MYGLEVSERRVKVGWEDEGDNACGEFKIDIGLGGEFNVVRDRGQGQLVCCREGVDNDLEIGKGWSLGVSF
ncbi:hypothetical protein SESBI_20779 [Sesbania bispinosa]|nr:hypothetical protein SESBI_20779 [Sesbania bispinosa]